MKHNMSIGLKLFLLSLLIILQACQSEQAWEWQSVQTNGLPTPRHEASFVEHKGQLYLLGGRRINPVDVFDPSSKTWRAKSPTPLEVNHFQAVSLGDAIYLVGAMTGQYPNEKPLKHVMAYYPETDTFETLHEIPESRRRGGAGAVAYNNKIYIIGGIVNGHLDGYVPWLDEYDPKTGEWRVLPNAQFARDHIQAAVLNEKLYVFGGRTSRKRTDQVLELLVKHGEIFDLVKRQWEPVSQDLELPTLRAGNMVLAWGNEIVVTGGESHTQIPSHSESESFDTHSRTWRRWPDLLEARHGSGLAIHDGFVYVASGSANRGGGPELTTVERLKLPDLKNGVVRSKAAVMSAQTDSLSLPVSQIFHTVTLDFEGPMLSESDTPNPFSDYRLDVEFSNAEGQRMVRGFFAADGDAANTGADKGTIWRVRFTPHLEGKWRYTATLRKGSGIAILDQIEDAEDAEEVAISNVDGEFFVVPSDKELPDFRAHGFVAADGPYFRFRDTNQYWLKAGSNSPENILGFVEFDGTYQHARKDRDGEAAAALELHRFEAHVADWTIGDPSWQGGKGKALIGAYNYLASKGMNSSYFLTLNINGDGKDVWPFVSHDDFTRFDVSKLAQWNIVFDHMQAKGILLHLTIQETENERLFDDGETGPQRKLYLNELIARFAHHPGLVWNLGEENGPASHSPIGQNHQQRKAMSDYFAKADPYDHTVLLHTHSTPGGKEEIVAPQLGHLPLDGLSFQVEKRPMVNSEIQQWRKRSKAAGKEWLITMDEIGIWKHGAVPDAEDPGHQRLRHWVLWGTLLGGGAGVEWYFGAKHQANDLTSNDWRLRDRLWTLTNHARSFFEKYLPYWEMTANNDLVEQVGDTENEPSDHPEHSGQTADELIPDVGQKRAYAFAKEGEIYVAYLSNVEGATLNLSNTQGEFTLHWFDPLKGGALQLSSKTSLAGGSKVTLGDAPNGAKQDWVILVRKVAN